MKRVRTGEEQPSRLLSFSNGPGHKNALCTLLTLTTFNPSYARNFTLSKSWQSGECEGILRRATTADEALPLAVYTLAVCLMVEDEGDLSHPTTVGVRSTSLMATAQGTHLKWKGRLNSMSSVPIVALKLS
ncbi:hypothetical protein GOBAR_DD03999 [Gossypium barbadense]|nr:hypothetical protein GOBAR_DD03999 [Gossypium barbadense]